MHSFVELLATALDFTNIDFQPPQTGEWELGHSLACGSPLHAMRAVMVAPADHDHASYVAQKSKEEKGRPARGGLQGIRWTAPSANLDDGLAFYASRLFIARKILG